MLTDRSIHSAVIRDFINDKEHKDTSKISLISRKSCCWKLLCTFPYVLFRRANSLNSSSFSQFLWRYFTIKICSLPFDCIFSVLPSLPIAAPPHHLHHPSPATPNLYIPYQSFLCQLLSNLATKRNFPWSAFAKGDAGSQLLNMNVSKFRFSRYKHLTRTTNEFLRDSSSANENLDNVRHQTTAVSLRIFYCTDSFVNFIVFFAHPIGIDSCLSDMLSSFVIISLTL